MFGGDTSEKITKIQHQMKGTPITPGSADLCDFRNDATTLDLFCDLHIGQALKLQPDEFYAWSYPLWKCKGQTEIAYRVSHHFICC